MRSGVGLFVLKVLLAYGLLVVAPWQGLKDAYAGIFRAAGRCLFASFGSNGVVEFTAAPPNKPPWDTQVRLVNRALSRAWTMNYSAWRTGYLPTAALTALVLATPVSWLRRGWAMVFGLAIVHAFVALRVAIAAFRWFREVDLFVFGGLGNWLVDLSFEVVSVSTVTSCVVPVLIWGAVTFRRSDGPRLLGRGRSESAFP